jgi:hypothetical protein
VEVVAASFGVHRNQDKFIPFLCKHFEQRHARCKCVTNCSEPLSSPNVAQSRRADLRLSP